MSSSLGHNFRLTTFGESHGTAIGGVIDGMPSGVVVDRVLIENEMRRRQDAALGTQRREADRIEILSGVNEETTLGTPLAFLIHNADVRSADYEPLRQLFRSGHADFTYWKRYGIRDYRGGGRASARETAVRVAAGAFAKMALAPLRLQFSTSYLVGGPVPDDDSRGGTVMCTITGLPAGIGDPIFDKLNARLAAAMMSIPSATGFEMGAGFEAASMTGSEYADRWEEGFRTASNHCGGVQGGISNGMPVHFRVAFHPVVSFHQPQHCIDADGRLHTVTIDGRHDHCQVPRAAVVVEAMAALVLADLVRLPV